VLAEPGDRAALLDGMAARFERRERSEIERIQRVLALVTADDCQVRALVAYFGEERPDACGHCSHCLSGAVELPPATPTPAPESVVAASALADLQAEHPGELAQPRQLARFLCGLSSPATTRAKLSRNEHYGALAAHHFAAVLEAVSPARP
jgi:ATP-dependent DNA helicase RecQ